MTRRTKQYFDDYIHYKKLTGATLSYDEFIRVFRYKEDPDMPRVNKSFFDDPANIKFIHDELRKDHLRDSVFRNLPEGYWNVYGGRRDRTHYAYDEASGPDHTAYYHAWNRTTGYSTYSVPKPPKWEHPSDKYKGPVGKRDDLILVEGYRFRDPVTNVLWNVTLDYPLCILTRMNEDGTGKLDRIRWCHSTADMEKFEERLKYIFAAHDVTWRHWEQVT